MILDLDDFLIDRALQPLVDRLARWVSCYALAAFVLTGFVLSAVAIDVYRGLLVGAAADVGCFSWTVRRAYRLEASPPSDVLPVDRFMFLPMRLFCGGMSVSLVGWAAVHAATVGADGADLWFLNYPTFVLGVYLMACRRRPPRPRVVRMPATGLAAWSGRVG